MSSSLMNRLGKELLIFDGAMGTEIQKTGYKTGHVPEEINIRQKETIIGIHKSYLRAGADFITTNTFGCNRYKAKDSSFPVSELLRAGIENAVEAKKSFLSECKKGSNGKEDLTNTFGNVSREIYIALDIGPLGQMLEPIGNLTFNEAYDAFSEVIKAAGNSVDAIFFETMTDLYELKAGILAAKENSSLPVFVSMTFDENGRTLTGTDALTYVTTVEALHVDAVGVNCSCGPKALGPVMECILGSTKLPVIFQPNAGLPKLKGKETVFDLTPDEFIREVKPIASRGVAVVGGCCGTDPAFIAKLKQDLTAKVKARRVKSETRVTSGTVTKVIGKEVSICGERLNPTGKKKLKEAILAGNFDVLVHEAIAQEEAGADVLDVNLGVPGIDETACMKKVIPMLQAATSLPLQIDSSSPEAIEAACRIYNGKPLINSVNGKEESLGTILPIVQKYGGVLIGLTLENDIPKKASDRVKIANKIIRRAKTYGIEKKDLVIDCLTLTASAQQEDVAETLKAVSMISAKGFNTALGVSNVSFGLPNRPLLNKTFLSMALCCGLTLPIINPLDSEMMGTIDAFRVLLNLDLTSLAYISKHSEDVIPAQVSAVPASGNIVSVNKRADTSLQTQKSSTSDNSLEYLIGKGLIKETSQKTSELLTTSDPLELVNGVIVPALANVGRSYETGRIFLPQLIKASEAAKAAFAEVQKHFKSASEKKGPVVIATVEGDIHDIGKNIVKVVLESYGYDVIDLGKSVPVSTLVEKVTEIKPKAIGLSALMTTTVVSMEKSIKALRKAGIKTPVFVGGAVLTEDIAKDIGADYYAVDAMASVRILNGIIG